MSDEPAVDLAVRREQLRLRSAQLREQIAVRTAVFRPVFHATDRVRGGVRGVQQVRQGRAPYVLGLLALLALAGALLVGQLESFSSFWASAFKEVIVFTLIIPVLWWRSINTHHVEDEE